ncbi:MAG: cellulase family glycosylhydrolase [Acidobacteriales bacterium]|nr:cellulase family glycosylhydrolase [Terriglobales bacterium]
MLRKAAHGALITLLCPILLLLSGVSQAPAETATAQGAHAGEPIPGSYFGVALHGDRWPSFPFGSSRVLVAWKLVEPARGKWDFRQVDAYIELAERNHADVLLDLGLTPPWASSNPEGHCGAGTGNCWPPTAMQDWRDYLSAVATRYKGRAHYYQVWNEPNQPDFYQGSMDTLVNMTRIAYEVIKGVDPSNMVLSPPPNGPGGFRWLNNFLAQGGKRYFDIVAFHFYPCPAPPESIVAQGRELRDVLARNGIAQRSMWDTEIGWTSPGVVLTDQRQAAYLAREIILDHIAGMSRFYWYIWNFAGEEELRTIDDGQTLSPAARAYGQVHKWLLGSVLTQCSSDDIPAVWHASHSMWTCELVREGKTSRIVWNTDGDRQFPVPRSWRTATVQNLGGETSNLPQSGEITIGEQPLLLQAR